MNRLAFSLPLFCLLFKIEVYMRVCVYMCMCEKCEVKVLFVNFFCIFLIFIQVFYSIYRNLFTFVVIVVFSVFLLCCYFTKCSGNTHTHTHLFSLQKVLQTDNLTISQCSYIFFFFFFLCWPRWCKQMKTLHFSK